SAVNSIEDLLPQVDGVDRERRRGRPGDWQRRRKREMCPKCGKPMPRWMGVCPDCMDKRGLMVRLMAGTKRSWVPATASFLLVLLTIGTNNVQPLLQKALVDDAFLGFRHPFAARLHTFYIIMAALLGLRVGMALIGAIRGFVMNWLGEKITLD